MLRKSLTIILLFAAHFALACEVCKKQQPKPLQGITHGAGPQSSWDYLIVAITAVIVLISLYLSIRWITRPGEKEVSHIKYSIFNTDAYARQK